MDIKKWQERLDWFFFKQRLYMPIVPYVLKLGYKAGSLSFFTAANPGLKNGGFVNASKYDVLRQIMPAYLPKTLFVNPQQPKQMVTEALKTQEWHKFPLILKPDIGERGHGVKKINISEELAHHLDRIKSGHLLQEFVDLPLEFCILYYRMPDSGQGEISSIGFKDFLKVTGDGRSTLYELIIQDDYILQNINLELYLKRHSSYLNTIPLSGQELRITDVASRGTGVLFKNFNHLYSKELVHTFDRISRNVDGFYYGRFDVKATSFESLVKGEGIKILELNGVNGQPIHCYDPLFTQEQFVQELKRHWQIIFDISIENIKTHKLKPRLGNLLKEISIHISRHQ